MAGELSTRTWVIRQKRASGWQAGELYESLGPQVSADLTLEMARSYGELGIRTKPNPCSGTPSGTTTLIRRLLKRVEGLVRLNLVWIPKSFVADIRREIVKLNNQGVAMARPMPAARGGCAV